MASKRFANLCLFAACVVIAITISIPAASSYDPLDPVGNVTIMWDIPKFTGDGYEVNVQIWNYQFYRKIRDWKLSWTWVNGEYIWGAKGGEAEEQGDCSKITSPGGAIPHCCLDNPTIVDLPAPLTGEGPLKNCCKSGYLGCRTQDPGTSLAAFTLTVGNASSTIWDFVAPSNFSLGLDNYHCSEAYRTKNTEKMIEGSVRKTQSLVTYKAVCTYSKMPVKSPPKCCVAFSAFYNNTIVPCPACSCACGEYGKKSVLCMNTGNAAAYNTPYLTTSGTQDGMELQSDPRAMLCSPDGCPISVHWHVKVNYEGFWRAKMTVTNRNLWVNYTDWNLVFSHPNVGNMTDVFSFNAVPVEPYGVNNTVVMWGLPRWNEVLMPAGKGGNVQSELLFEKTQDFTFSKGWAFPKKIMFNGEECAMPETFPMLPSASRREQQGALLASLAAMGLGLVVLLF